MVTGAYAPETSGASLQCRNLIRALRDDVDFTVLTTSTNPSLPWHSDVDGIRVRRIAVNPASLLSKAIAIERMASSVLELSRDFDIVIKLTSVGHDDPASIRAAGKRMWAAYRRADRFIGVTPRFLEGFQETGLDPNRFVFIPNGVDLDRFKPASPDARAALQQQLRIPSGDPVILFVGFFSREKNPDVLFDAWLSLLERGLISTLVFIGATTGSYYEIDASIAAHIKRRAHERGVSDRVVFVESTDNIEDYYRAADIFALPTAREGLPNVLLEAMASGVPPVITRLTGVTDWIVDSGVTGVLVPAADSREFESAIGWLLRSREVRQQMGRAARAHVAGHFDITRTARQTLDVYEQLLPVDRT